MLYKKIIFCIGLLFAMHSVSAQSAAEKSVRAILQNQILAWNKGDIEEYMSGYWQSDSLVFVGKAGPTYGWKQTLDRYKRSYDSKEKMGTLSFQLLQVKRIDKQHYFVLGQWSLKRTVGDVGGHFTLLFRRFKEGWRIVVDHSS